MDKLNKKSFSYYGRILWLYTKYQLLTKTFLFLIIFPIFKLIVRMLISSTNRVSISSGDYIDFLLSIQGIVFLLCSLFVLAILVGVDIIAFVILSSLIKENKLLTARHLLVVSIKSLKYLINPPGILIMLYVAIILPLVGIGIGISVMENFKIPNFITDVIFKNKLYTTVYFTFIAIFILVTLNYIFFFHYLIIDNQSIKSSLKKSSNIMRKNWKNFLQEIFIKTGIKVLILIFILLVIIYLLFSYSESIENTFFRRLATIFISIFTTQTIYYIALISVPIIFYKLTSLFYKYNEKGGYKISIKLNFDVKILEKKLYQKIRLRTKLLLSISVILLTIFNFMTALVFSIFFDDMFKNNKDIAIVAHRGGGNLAAENSILGMEKDIEKGAKWSEIDVQRTKDGHYIINHDSTFSRLSNNNKPSSELTIDEINNLTIKDLFDKNRDAQPIPTLEQFLDEFRGKIGLFIELKGNTADEKMVDDAINIVKSKGMGNDIAILSLDYKLIDYTESKYPEIDTGYLYFFSVGDVKNLKSDILIMEEQEVSPEKLEKIHSVGKKAIVWTVNTDDSVEKFVLSDVDGIITDYVEKVRDGIITRDNRTDLEIIIDSVFN